MENHFGAPASSGTPEERSARREFELLVLLGGSRKGAVQLWKWERRQRIYANAQQAAGRLATDRQGLTRSRRATGRRQEQARDRRAGRAAAPQRAQTAREAPRAQHLGCGEGAQAPQQVVRASASSGREAACTITIAPSATTSTAGGCPATSTAATSAPPPAPDQAQARATPPAGAAAAASPAPDVFMTEGPP